MINRSDKLSAELPPVTPCPPWCAEGFHAWQPDANEYVRQHTDGAHPVELFRFDRCVNGKLLPGETGIAVHGEPLTFEDAERLAAALTAAVQAAQQ